MPIRVAVVEDQRLIRELLVELLRREGFDVIGEACDGAEALALPAAHPDVVLLDVNLPDMSGVEVARELRARAPRTRIVAVSVHDSPAVVAQMLRSGVGAYVAKGSSMDEIVQAIGAVLKDHIYLSPGLALPAGEDDRRAPDARLGRRERQVVVLIAQGRRTPQIAAELGISQGTVEVHRRNIMRKLGLHTVAELTRYAMREGWISP